MDETLKWAMEHGLLVKGFVRQGGGVRQSTSLEFSVNAKHQTTILKK